MADLVPTSKTYLELLDQLKGQIRAAQVKAALAVNRELVLLYWDIGRQILERQTSEGWGKNVIPRLPKDLSSEFPEMKGLSPRNLGYMKAFAEAWPEEPILQQLAAKLPWFHNCIILDKIKVPEERVWYIQAAIQNGWSRNVLAMQIESNLYTRQGKAITNFQATLPAPQSDLAQQLIKDPYNFDFLTLPRKRKSATWRKGYRTTCASFSSNSAPGLHSSEVRSRSKSAEKTSNSISSSTTLSFGVSALSI
jgi:predicted nuclease of restriction endonuclease-like (RecB) superfamily